MDIEFLIVGQGLAGSLLAFELIRRRSTVLVVDGGEENASKIAAGLINPVTGKRLAKTEAVDRLLPEAEAAYQTFAQFFGREFFVQKPLLRLIRTEAELDAAHKRLDDPAYNDYLGSILSPEELNYPISGVTAILEQKRSGYISTRPLLEHFKSYFETLGAYCRTTLDYQDIELRPRLRWRDVRPHYIVFCEGYKVIDNPWFGRLPFQPAKGRILTLLTEQRLPDAILNYAHWLLPLETGFFRTGATFEHGANDISGDEYGRKQLLDSLAGVAPHLASARVLEERVGIRPCTQDRYPFVGPHPDYPKLWLFNGFGAKGSLMIPYYSRLAADVLLTQASLESSCRIDRR
ncbi:MAG: NAD(P)/FAD-dependent oxidoreductase [Gammaproteobacteria bacterium]